ncbi:MAG: nitroreductase, partial [Slackia sp.]|nr:nitroreductase [Slackia sp.]
EMMAAACGAGVLHSGFMTRVIERSPAMQEWLRLDGRTVACCMLVGYSAVKYKRTAPRKEAKATIR